MLAEDCRAILQRLRTDFEYYAPRALWIQTKEGRLEPLQLNAAQRYIHQRLQQQLADKGMIRAIILKGRQQGVSTYTEGRFFHHTSMREGVRAYILTHRDEATANLFGMAKRYFELCPEYLRPSIRKSNAKELEFDQLMSEYKVATAGGKGAGRSTTVQLMHGSEIAFWPSAETHIAGLGQTVPLAPGTEMILESTANGVGNVFHRLWQEATRGEGLYQAIFVPWFWQGEYAMTPPPGFELEGDDRRYQEAHGLSLPQMAWRAQKIRFDFLGDVSLFDQEYPATADLAFQRVQGEPFIRSELVGKARRAEYEGKGPLIMGVDPAEMGEDATAIAFRTGRALEPVQTWHKCDTMAVAGIAAHLIEQRDPDAVFVDAVGIGAGVYARLVELFPRMVIHRIMSGERAMDDDRYANRRAEMWGRLGDWLEDGAQVPDDDALHGEMTSVQWGFDSSGRIRLERKEQEYVEKLAALTALRTELTAKENRIDPAALGEVPSEDTEGTAGDDEGVSGVEQRRRRYDPYTQDLFGDALPAPEPERVAPDAAQREGSAELGGDVEPAGGIRAATKVVQTQTGQLTTGYPTVTNWGEAAHTAAQLRKHPQEHFLTLVLDKDRRVIAALRHTIGGRDGARVYPELVAGTIYAVPGAAEVVFAHNHPSGVARLSAADEHIAKKIAELMRDTGIEVWGLMAVGRDRYGYIDTREFQPTGSAEQPIPPARRRTTVPILERMYRKAGRLSDTSVTGQYHALHIAGELLGERTGLLLLDNQYYPIGVIPLAAEDLKTLRGAGGTAARILRSLHETNAAAALLVTDGTIDEADVRNVGTLFRGIEVRLLDVLEPRRSLSWAALGLDLHEPGQERYYSRGESERAGPKGPRHTVESLTTALRRALQPLHDLAEPLLAAPWFHVVSNATGAPDLLEASGLGGRVKGWYDPNSGQVYLRADALARDTSDAALRGLVLHEIGVHLRHLGQSGKAWQNILKQFDAMEQAGDKAVGAAYRRAMLAGPAPGRLHEEALAYYIEAHPDLPFARRVLAWLRMMIRKLGETFQGLHRTRWMRWANTLSTDDLVAMARGALRGAVRNPRYPDVLPRVTNGVTAQLRQEDQRLRDLLKTYANEKGAPSEAEIAEAVRQYGG